MNALLYDDYDWGQETRDCEWCHSREAEEDEMIFDVGQLRVCEECATMLLASIADDG